MSVDVPIFYTFFSEQSRSPVDEKKREPKKRLSDEAVKKRVDDHVEKLKTSRGRSHERRTNDEDSKKSDRRHVSYFISQLAT